MALKNLSERNWTQLKGLIQRQWGELTDDDMDRIDGSQDRLIAALTQRYGVCGDEARRMFYEWMHSQVNPAPRSKHVHVVRRSARAARTGTDA